MTPREQRAAAASKRLRQYLFDPLGRGDKKRSSAPWYNSLLVIVGLWHLTDMWGTFFAYVLIAEGFLWTIEHAGQWRDEP